MESTAKTAFGRSFAEWLERNFVPEFLVTVVRLPVEQWSLELHYWRSQVRAPSRPSASVTREACVDEGDVPGGDRRRHVRVALVHWLDHDARDLMCMPESGIATHRRQSRNANGAQAGDSIVRRGSASGGLARIAGHLRQGKAERIDQPTSPRLRQHR